ncbi:hypothetical protein STEG23_004849 [Scotinomys teguina]
MRKRRCRVTGPELLMRTEYLPLLWIPSGLSEVRKRTCTCVYQPWLVDSVGLSDTKAQSIQLSGGAVWTGYLPYGKGPGRPTASAMKKIPGF